MSKRYVLFLRALGPERLTENAVNRPKMSLTEPNRNGLLVIANKSMNSNRISYSIFQALLLSMTSLRKRLENMRRILKFLAAKKKQRN